MGGGRREVGGGRREAGGGRRERDSSIGLEYRARPVMHDQDNLTRVHVAIVSYHSVVGSVSTTGMKSRHDSASLYALPSSSMYRQSSPVSLRCALAVWYMAAEASVIGRVGSPAALPSTCEPFSAVRMPTSRTTP